MKFNERFKIPIDQTEAHNRFVNRAADLIFELAEPEAIKWIALRLGEKYYSHRDYSDYTKNEFLRTLQAIEAVYEIYRQEYKRERLVTNIGFLLNVAEFDLGVIWKDGHFYPAGASLLDKGLVNDALDWLREQEYATVVEPFQKGLRHYLESSKRPELLADVITDMYESVEALAKIITKRDRDLSGNAEKFLSLVRASDSYKKILKEYIHYANKFRHAVKEGTTRPSIDRRESESFIYLTGLFIRLAM